MGVPVIMAHAASLGKNIQLSDEIKRRLDSGKLDLTRKEGQRIYCDDLNSAGKRGSSSWINNFDLFLRLMKQEKYKGILYGEISAITQANRLPAPLIELIRHRDLHDRLINGSDYPLPGLNVVIRTKKLMQEGFITKQEIKTLNEIYRVNPLLFDFVVKRTIRLPETGGSLPSTIFTGHPGFTELENAWFDQQSIQ
jgi:hypothetical protein